MPVGTSSSEVMHGPGGAGVDKRRGAGEGCGTDLLSGGWVPCWREPRRRWMVAAAVVEERAVGEADDDTWSDTCSVQGTIGGGPPFWRAPAGHWGINLSRIALKLGFASSKASKSPS